ncbi:MAG TPA: glucose-6-phosphate dehydrogenase [Bacteroidales bacterium]|nr:glucose-6-phosphate dehydrogenase [Bacteroidales bacterium]
MNKPEDHIIVIFGGRGDLAMRKIMPALYALFVQGLLPDRFAIIGTGRNKLEEDKYRSDVRDALAKFSAEKEKTLIEKFLVKMFYLLIDPADTGAYSLLSAKLEDVRNESAISGNTLFYLSVPPDLYDVIPLNLALHRLNIESDGWKRVIIEKPFGTDYDSAVELNEKLQSFWKEHQIYRIDHYLGKETVQNILVTRFSNGIFEPLWNRNYVHHVEITSSESLGIEKRGAYYERAGALRDMIQNHLLHLVGFVAMEPPSSIDSNSIHNEVVKVFQSFRPIKQDEVVKCAIRGQYTASHIKGELVKGYREEENVSPESKTETFAALKFYIDNWRWGGVPFYIRTGKRLPTRVTEAVIHFRETPHSLFSQKSYGSGPNQLIIRIQPDEGILIKFGMKIPGAGFIVENVNMDFHYSDLAVGRIPEAYERLLYDSMNGDSTLYTRSDEVMAAWRFLEPVIREWETTREIPVYGYPAGSWGPEKVDELIDEPDLTWRYPCKNLADDGIYCEL